MPLAAPLSARRAIAVVLAVAAFGGRARAEDGAGASRCVAGVRVDVGPTSIDPARARAALEAIASELEPQRATVCEGASTRIAVEWGDEEKARVVVEAEEAGHAQRVARDLDLANIDKDGRPLAIAIAADELAHELRHRLAIASAPPREPPAAPIAIAPSTREKPAAEEPRARRWSLGASGVVQATTSGAALAGPDLRLDARLGEHLLAIAHAGPRSPIARGDEAPGLSGGIVAGVGLALAPMRLLDRAGVAPTLALDVIAMHAGSHGTMEATIAPTAGVVAWLRLAPALALTADARAGALPLPLHLSREDGARASVYGGTFLGSIGVASSF